MADSGDEVSDGKESCKVNSEARARIRYSKEELFALARSAYHNEPSFIDLLSKLENTDWTPLSYPIEGDDRCLSLQYVSTDFQPPIIMKSVTSFGRQRSEFSKIHMAGKLSSGHRTSRRGSRYADDKQQALLHRMASSPQIKWTPNPADRLEQENRISNKYSPRMDDGKQNARGMDAPVNAKNRRGSFTSERRRRMLDSENGCESLPCFGDSEPLRQTLVDEFLKSPIVRIGLRHKSCDQEGSGGDQGEDQEDQFDITSMLSITVLSDIKTIKQDEIYPAKTSSETREKRQHDPKFGAKFGGVPRDRPSMKHLGRAKTFTDFARSIRRVEEKSDHQKRQNIGRIGHESIVSQGYYDWSSIEQPSSSLMLDSSLAKSPTPTGLSQQEKTVDETARQIIESFKSQVIARAKAARSSQDEAEKVDRHSIDSSVDTAQTKQSVKGVDEDVKKSGEIDKKPLGKSIANQASKLPRLISLQQRAKGASAMERSVERSVERSKDETVKPAIIKTTNAKLSNQTSNRVSSLRSKKS